MFHVSLLTFLIKIPLIQSSLPIRLPSLNCKVLEYAFHQPARIYGMCWNCIIFNLQKRRHQLAIICLPWRKHVNMEKTNIKFANWIQIGVVIEWADTDTTRIQSYARQSVGSKLCRVGRLEVIILKIDTGRGGLRV